MSEAHSSDVMRDLVKFMISLALLGTIIALAAYFLVALPNQIATGITAPQNWCVLDPTGHIFIC